MSDDTTSGDDQDAADLSARRRRQAEGAAADLARMGIDPRSLGLSGESEPPRTPQDRAEAPGRPGTDPEPDEQRASVVQLRPDVDPRPPAGTGPVGIAAAGRPSSGLPATDGAPARPEALEPGRGPEGEERSTSHPVRDLLARTTRPAEPERPHRWLLRAVGKGLSTPDAAESVASDREVVEAVRRRQSDRRIVAFVSGKGGVGCTSVAVGVGTCLVALRDDRSVVLDVHQGAVPLSQLHDAPEGLDLAAVGSLDVDTPLPAAPSGLALVDSVEWGLQAGRRDLAQALERVGADHAFALLDVGSDSGEAAHAALARADQVVVVTGAGRHGVVAHAAAMERVQEVNPAAVDGVVHVVVCPHDEAHRGVQREVVAHLRQRDADAVVVLGPEPHLAAGAPYAPAAVGVSTREAMLRIAAAVALGGRR